MMVNTTLEEEHMKVAVFIYIYIESCEETVDINKIDIRFVSGFDSHIVIIVLLLLVVLRICFRFSN